MVNDFSLWVEYGIQGLEHIHFQGFFLSAMADSHYTVIYCLCCYMKMTYFTWQSMRKGRINTVGWAMGCMLGWRSFELYFTISHPSLRATSSQVGKPKIICVAYEERETWGILGCWQVFITWWTLSPLCIVPWPHCPYSLLELPALALC